MEIATRSTGGVIAITITGTIKTIADGQSIKDALKRAHESDAHARIEIHIKDSFIITSSMIGFFIKSIKIDKIAMDVFVYSDELYMMLDEMSLIDSMRVRRAHA